MYEHLRFIDKLLFVAWVFGWQIKLGNFTLKNFDLIIRTSDEAHVKHCWHSTKFLSSYYMIKGLEKILIECLNLWRGNINQVQYSWVSKCQQGSTVACKFNHMCVHAQEKIQSSNTINAGLKKFQKNFKVQLQSNKVEKILKKIFKVQFKSTGFEKNSKNFQSSTQVGPEWKKFQSFKCLVEKCQKIFENILSPNQWWLHQEKFQSFKFRNHWMKKNQKINSKFRLAEIFSNFSRIFTVQHWSLWQFNVYTWYLRRKWLRNKLFPSQIKIHKGTKCFNSNSTKFYVQVQLIQDGWHMKTCDFLWKCRMIWSFYERIG